jgi:thiol-disulfide isomerase/thioredoxin
MRGWWAAGVVVAAVAGVGAADDPAAKKKDPPKVELTVAEKADTLDAAIKAHKGKVVFVDFWATWCKPCVEKFPHLVELHKKYADKGLVCISVSFDDLDDKARALDFLKEKGATFPNLLLTDYDGDGGKKLETRYGFRGSIPYFMVFARNGEKVWDIRDKKSDKEIDELVEAELAKK